ncbi:phage tail tape measure protein [Aliivibrio logei]|uniref:phage tail tape measure protein n=1 Tax=Aliivibrio logei TaxID=688 RepID=UPI00039AA5AF|nr:phage tail tape measure protein [Aliivibrio logei]
MSNQKSKVSLLLDVTTKGLSDVVSTTNATEKLNGALEQQRGEVSGLNRDLKKVEGYQATEQSLQKVNAKLDASKVKFSGLGSELNDSQKKSRVLAQSYKSTELSLGLLHKKLADPLAFNLSQSETKSLGVEVAKTELRLEKLSDEMAANAIQTNKLRSSQYQAKKQIDRYSSSSDTQSAKLKKLQKELKGAGLNTDKLSDEQQRLKTASERATGALEKQGRQLKELNSIQSRIDKRNAKLGELQSQASGLAMAAAPIAGTMYAAIKNESSFADVKKVLSDKNDPQDAAKMKALREWSLKESGNMPMSATEINAMLAAGGQSGIKDHEKLKAFVLDSAKMGVAFDMEAGEAGETLATFKASMGLDQKGAVGLAGLSNYLSNNSNAKAKDIASVMAREGATAKTGGFKVNESAALAASLLSTGMNEERAATALKNISGRLTLGDAASGNQQKALSSLGFDSSSLAADMQTDASGTLLEVLDALKNAPLEEQSALISQIFGEEAKGAVAALAGNTKNFTDILKLANESQEVHVQSLQDEYDARVNTTENGIKQFVNKLNVLAVVLGEKLLPGLNWVLTPLGAMVDGVTAFAQESDVLVPIIMGGIGAILAFKTALIAGKAASLLFGNTVDKTRLFKKGLNRETKESGKAASYATRAFKGLNQELRRTGGSRRSRGGSGKRSGRRSRSRNPLSRVARSFSHSKKGIPLALAGGAIASLPGMAMAQDAIDMGADMAQSAGRLGLAKVLRPLNMAISGIDAVQSLSEGDTEGAGSSLGSLIGGMGGASLGAAIGTMILPGIGTMIGGLAGSMIGDMGGEMLGGWFGSKLASSDEVSQKVEEKANKETLNAQSGGVHFAPQINITPSKNQDEVAIAKHVTEQMQQQFSYLMGGHSIESRFNYAGIDRG